MADMRIIPAYAGSTHSRRRVSGTGRDHPRIRGEHGPSRIVQNRHYGSSPHTRGALRGAGPRCRRRRIIPAYAGSTHRLGCAGDFGRDHPRIRGEHDSLSTEKFRARGSSPHTRGAPMKRPARPTPTRIIPAYAGSTRCARGYRARRPDHPRIRGEHPLKPSDSPIRSGSSPHTRGALRPAAARRVKVGIIPAYAGSTAGVRPGTGGGPDHPRIRGEHG